MSARDRTGQLLRALRHSATTAGCKATVEHEATTSWASATFVGARYSVRVGGAASAAWLGTLPEAEFDLHGCFVADCAVEDTVAGTLLTVLVLEE